MSFSEFDGATLRSFRGQGAVAFERDAMAYLGVPHAIGVKSGTAALHLAMVAADIGPGEVAHAHWYAESGPLQTAVGNGGRPAVQLQPAGMPLLRR